MKKKILLSGSGLHAPDCHGARTAMKIIYWLAAYSLAIAYAPLLLFEEWLTKFQPLTSSAWKSLAVLLTTAAVIGGFCWLTAWGGKHLKS